MPNDREAKDSLAAGQPLETFGISKRNHLAQRKAVGDLLQRQKRLFVLRKDFSQGGMTARIRYGNRYYDVDGAGLAQIRDGIDPADIWTAEEVDPTSP
ncbi:hypothetical protein [Tianweitania sediminis]|uniref:Uncharacterized protein n=1 Tax=Tianweitania sediminis TaxID=1502156 RepID=A0A8J7R0P3_9HYPH|nr:hypothetical protein [Tianweitania sediminis]MBP0437881.1 hypothetical protein [Tianweitania sediminis]